MPHKNVTWDTYWISNTPTREWAELELAKLEKLAMINEWKSSNFRRKYKIEQLKKYLWNLH